MLCCKRILPFVLIVAVTLSRMSPVFCGEDPADASSPASDADIAGAARNNEYKISPYDLIEISIYQEPDLSRTVRVSHDGNISFPLIGKVNVAGATVLEAEGTIADLLGQKYLVNPQVTVFVKEYQNNKIFILGEVKNPGSYDIPQNRDLTVLEAITLAGGFTSIAAVNKTKIIRTENGKQKYIEVKINDITQKGDKSKDITLNTNDVIFVPERIF